MSLSRWIATHSLAPHPEGGVFRETFRSDEVVQTSVGPRAASTAILYALPAGGHSAWHRVVHDEVWHVYEGGPLRLHLLSDEGFRVVVLGDGSCDGAVPQAVVPGGTWQAAEADGDVLCGCTVAPGFDFADFTMARGPALAARFPDHAEEALRLAAPDEENP